MQWVGDTIVCAKWLRRCTLAFVGNDTPHKLSGQRSSNSILCRLYSYKFMTYWFYSHNMMITSLLKQPLMSVGMHILWPEPHESIKLEIQSLTSPVVALNLNSDLPEKHYKQILECISMKSAWNCFEMCLNTLNDSTSWRFQGKMGMSHETHQNTMISLKPHETFQTLDNKKKAFKRH